MQRLRSCLPRQLRSSSQSSPSGLGSIPRTTRDARYRSDTLKEIYKHCSRHSFSISIFRLNQITLLLTLSALFVGIVTPVYFNNYTSSFYFMCISTIYIFWSPLIHPCITGLPFWFVCLRLYAYTSRSPHTSIPLRTIPLFSSFSLHWLWKQTQAGAVDPLFPLVPFCLLCCPTVE